LDNQVDQRHEGTSNHHAIQFHTLYLYHGHSEWLLDGF
jgi:hypothetical protein